MDCFYIFQKKQTTVVNGKCIEWNSPHSSIRHGLTITFESPDTFKLEVGIYYLNFKSNFGYERFTPKIYLEINKDFAVNYTFLPKAPQSNNNPTGVILAIVYIECRSDLRVFYDGGSEGTCINHSISIIRLPFES